MYTSTTLSTNPRSVVNYGSLSAALNNYEPSRLVFDSLDYVQITNNNVDFVLNSLSKFQVTSSTIDFKSTPIAYPIKYNTNVINSSITDARHLIHKEYFDSNKNSYL